MPEECPKCGEERCYIDDPPHPNAGRKSEIELVEDELMPLDRNLNCTWLCKKCGFKWIEFYQEHEWTSLEEFKGDSGVSWRSPVYPYKEMVRDFPYRDSPPYSTRFGPFAKAFKEQYGLD